MRLILGISGASGTVLGFEMLKALKNHPDIEVHLIMTEDAMNTLRYETQITERDFFEMAEFVHDNKNLAASISSGSFRTDGMIVMPCSMKTLSGIATGYTNNLLTRAADVCLKENRKVVLVPREMPLGKIHLQNLNKAAELGCIVVPPVLTFYKHANTLEAQIDHIIGKILMQFSIEHQGFTAWEGK